MTTPFETAPLGAWIDAQLAMTTPPWLVDNLIPKSGITFLSGRPKQEGQKSFLAQGLALAVASGSALGPFTASAPGRVWYIDREGPPQFAARRWLALCAGHSFDPDALRERVLYTHLGAFYLDKEKILKLACETADTWKPDLIIIDTLAQSMTGDENEVEATMAAFRGLNRLRDVNGAGVMVVHHVKKAQRFSSMNGTPQPDLDARGSGALNGAWDMHLAVREYQGYPRMLLTGGKIAPAAAYTYSWDIQADEKQQLTSACLISEPLNLDEIVIESFEKPDTYG